MNTKDKKTHRLAYLASLHGYTANEHLGRIFPRLKKPQLYQNWSDAHKNESELIIDNDNIGKVYVSSDHHFDHANIIKYANRPFKDKGSMNEYMIRRHNEVVRPDDISLLLGDVAFCDTKTANTYLDRMNGYKIMIIGNHDWVHRKPVIKNLHVDEMHVSYYLDVPVMFDNAFIDEVPDDQGCIFTHAPFDSMEVFRHDLVNFHGHIHDKSCGLLRYQNMCVEWLDYTPRNLLDLVSQYNKDETNND